MNKSTRKAIENEQDKLLNAMMEDGTTDERRQQLTSIYWDYEQMLTRHKITFSPDTVLVVGGNLLGILLILHFEKIGIISTKALGFVLKGRV